MSDGVLSQEEIDALLKGGSSSEPEPEEPLFSAAVEETIAETAPVMEAATQENVNISLESLTPEETDAIGEVANIVMGSAATALSSLVGQKIDITTPNVRITTLANIRKEHPIPYLLVNVEYVKGIEGSNVLIIKNTDAAMIADLMMGGDGSTPPEDLSEMQLSAVGEADRKSTRLNSSH